jgi:hypothetical protein
VLEVLDRPGPGQAGGGAIARVVLTDVPSDAPPAERAHRAIVVTLTPASPPPGPHR